MQKGMKTRRRGPPGHLGRCLPQPSPCQLATCLPPLKLFCFVVSPCRHQEEPVSLRSRTWARPVMAVTNEGEWHWAGSRHRPELASGCAASSLLQHLLWGETSCRNRNLTILGPPCHEEAQARRVERPHDKDAQQKPLML
ncbi:hypothetical protein HJG60_008916 [Phyllostomus discolor]|nr:hypothetical protein HJG60_008916 [Phyllostomus discolor]